MIITLIIVGIIVAALVAIGVIVVRAFPKLARIQTGTIREEKHELVKASIVEQRLERKLRAFSDGARRLLRPVWERIVTWWQRLRERIIALEKHYRQRARSQSLSTLEEREGTRQNINRLFTEADESVHQGNYAEAEKKYLEVIGLDMKNAEAYERLGWVYFEMKDYDHARETFEFIKKLNPRDDEIYLGLGEIYWALGKREQALLNAKEAVRLSPNHPRNLDFALELALAMNDRYLATTTLDKLKEVNPDNQKLKEFEERLSDME